MTPGLKTVIYPEKDLDAARRLYGGLLGVEPTTDQPYYVGFEIGDQQLGLDPNGHAKGMEGPVGYWHVDDLATTIETLVAAGATVRAEPEDVGGGRLIATVADADGNVFGLLQDA